MNRIKTGVDFIFSSYKRVAALLVIGGLLLAIPVTMSVINKQQDVRQRASEIASETGTSNSLIGTYKYTGTCTSGCTGDYEHTLKITEIAPAPQGNSGTFKGNGFYNAQHAITWDITGNYNLDTKTFSYHLVYTGTDPGYYSDGTGTIGLDGTTITGTTSSGYNQAGYSQRGTFTLTKVPCTTRPGGMDGFMTNDGTIGTPGVVEIPPPGSYCPNVAPTTTSVTIDPATITANGTSEYKITITSDDPQGGNTIFRQYASVNDPNNGGNQRRGLVGWSAAGFEKYWGTPPSYKSQELALPYRCIQGGGAVAIYGGADFGSQYMNVRWCKTSSTGNTRTTEMYVSFNTNFTSPTSNKLFGFTEDAGGLYSNWQGFSTFSVAATTPTQCGSDSATPNACPIGKECVNSSCVPMRCDSASATPNACPAGFSCNGSTCIAITPTPMHCGGNIANPVECPSGFTCQRSGVADVGGTCVPSTTCFPRPPCLDAEPACEVAIREDYCPPGTPTPTISGTSITVYLSLVGVGSTGEPGINNNPKRPIRDVEVQLTDSTNSGGGEASGIVAYQPSSGLYVGTIPLPIFAPGAYTTKVRLDNTLWKRISGIQNIVAGQNTQTPPTTLVSGDFNQDNVINLLDYNMLVSCSRSNCRNFFSKIDVKNYIAFFKKQATRY